MMSKNSGLSSDFPTKSSSLSNQTRSQLDAALAKYHAQPYLEWDPLEYVHHYTDPWDQEVAALIGGVLAHGRVVQIRKNVQDLLNRMEAVSGSISHYIWDLDGRTSEDFRGWVHRFNGSTDLYVFLRLISQSWRRYGSVGAHFCSKLSKADAHVGNALEAFIQDYKAWARTETLSHPVGKGFGFLLTAPSSESTCKRWLMILRWMGRKDQVDVGLWMKGSALWKASMPGHPIEPRQLLMPLDTHTGRIAKRMGLTRRKSLNWKAVIEVTETLRSLDPDDPAKYDFALCKLGMLEGSR